ncbi:MAG: LysR family transcriptional regulator [Clostridia bacterium]|nr:LysR family transcriptional regulator [Clostridia bacterium]
MKEHEYIYTVYEEGSFSRAAKKLFVSQPAISIAVKKVEEELGIIIFDRASQPLKLTDEGKIYIKSIEEILSIEHTMKQHLSDISDLKSGHITVSGENFVSSFILPEIIMEFYHRYSGIKVELMESNSPILRNQLLSETIDLLVSHDKDSDLFESRELFCEEVLLSVSASNKINEKLSDFALSGDDIRQGKFYKRKTIDLSLFKDEPFLVLKPGNDLNQRAALICSDFGFEPKTGIFLDQLITAYNLCAYGMGATFVTDILVKKTAVQGCLYYRINSEHASRKMCIVSKKHRYLTKAAAAFIETACHVYKNGNM